MIRTALWKTQIQTLFRITSIRQLASDSSKELIENAEVTINNEEDEALALREAEIEQKRNKSRLLPQHRNMLMNEVPYTEPQSWIHTTVKYNQKMYGRYGAKSNVAPNICWPTTILIEETEDYEKLAFPYTIESLLATYERKKSQTETERRLRQEQIASKITKLDQWKKDLHDKIVKKETEAMQAKERKDRLVEEVRRHFGFKMDPKDERFKEMLEKKEKEDKKNQKEAKRKAKEAKLIAKLQEIHTESKKSPENKTEEKPDKKIN